MNTYSGGYQIEPIAMQVKVFSRLRFDVNMYAIPSEMHIKNRDETKEKVVHP